MTTRTKKLKQAWIEGTEPPRIQEIEDAAQTYYDAMTERVRLSNEEAEAKDNLIERMNKNGLDRYETAEGLVVTVTSKSNVKAKRKKDEEGEDE